MCGVWCVGCVVCVSVCGVWCVGCVVSVWDVWYLCVCVCVSVCLCAFCLSRALSRPHPHCKYGFCFPLCLRLQMGIVKLAHLRRLTAALKGVQKRLRDEKDHQQCTSSMHRDPMSHVVLWSVLWSANCWLCFVLSSAHGCSNQSKGGGHIEESVGNRSGTAVARGEPYVNRKRECVRLCACVCERIEG